MRICATPTTRYETQTNLALEVAFDGGKLTSDGGLTWLSRVDSELGLCEKVAEHVPEARIGAEHATLRGLLGIFHPTRFVDIVV